MVTPDIRSAARRRHDPREVCGQQPRQPERGGDERVGQHHHIRCGVSRASNGVRACFILGVLLTYLAALCTRLNLIALLGDLNTIGFSPRPEQAGQPPHLLHTAPSHGVPCAQPGHGAALLQDHLQQLNKYCVCNNMGVHGAPWVCMEHHWAYMEHRGCAWSTMGVQGAPWVCMKHHGCIFHHQINTNAVAPLF